MERIHQALTEHLRLQPASGIGDLVTPAGLDRAAYALSCQNVAPHELWDSTIASAIHAHAQPSLTHVDQGPWVLIGLRAAANAVRQIECEDDSVTPVPLTA